MTLLSLENYAVSANRGFLAGFEPDRVALPKRSLVVRQAAMELPKSLVAGTTHEQIRDLPVLNICSLLPGTDSACGPTSDSAFDSGSDSAALRLLMVHYSFLVQAWVWGGAVVSDRLPECLARPIWQLSELLGQPPLLLYSTYVLDNWGRIAAQGELDLDNVHMLQPFLGGQDEAWFVMIHVAIEARAGAMLAAIPELLTAVENRDGLRAEALLVQMCDVWADLNQIFDRMPERCDPYVYFNRVRPWIHGWADNPALPDGVIYEGVAATGGRAQSFRGQTGSQSSIVPVMDALLGIVHAQDPMRIYLDQLHGYRPPTHRRFIDDVRASSNLRGFVRDSGLPALVSAYNACVSALTAFRTRHLEYAASYINKQSRGGVGNDTNVGTGGTPFMRYLKKHRDTARAHML